MVDANINLEETSRSSSMISRPFATPAASLPVFHRRAVSLYAAAPTQTGCKTFSTTPHTTSTSFSIRFPLVLWSGSGSPSLSIIITLLPLEGKGKNPLFLSFFPSSLSPSPPGRHHVRPLQPGLLPCKNPLPPD